MFWLVLVGFEATASRTPWMAGVSPGASTTPPAMSNSGA